MRPRDLHIKQCTFYPQKLFYKVFISRFQMREDPLPWLLHAADGGDSADLVYRHMRDHLSNNFTVALIICCVAAGLLP